MSRPKPRIHLSAIEQKIKGALSYVTFLPGSGDKRFYKSIVNESTLTDGQRNFMLKLFDKYRRQIPDYESLAMEIDPERFSVNLTFQNTLFGAETKLEIKDTHTDKKRWTKQDRINHSSF